MSTPKYAHIIKAITRRPWALHPDYLALMLDIVQFRADGGVLAEEEIQARIDAASNGPRKGSARSATVAVLPIYGVISPRQNLFSATSGGTSVESIRADLREALADPGVDGIVLDVDSPGGSVDLIDELAAEIRAARGQKPIVAVANTMMASAAYYLGSAADEIAVTPSGSVGSIGVVAIHEDMSKADEMEGIKPTFIYAGEFKTEGNPHEPLSQTALATIQADVDAFYGMFVSAVAKGRSYNGRKVSVDQVRSDFGKGRMLLAKDALAAGMVDRIATLEETVQRVGREAAMAKSSAAGGVGASRVAVHIDAETVAAFREAGYDDAAVAQAIAASLDPVSVTPGRDTSSSMDAAAEAAADTDDASAPGTGPTFKERLSLGLASGKELLEHAQEHAAMRANAGRSLSGATSDELLATATSFRGLADELEAIANRPDAGDASDPAEPPATASHAPSSSPPVRGLLDVLEAAARGGYHLSQQEVLTA